MEEAQYDIPWELKARAICALRARPFSATNDPSTSTGLVKVSPSMAGQPPKFSPQTPERSPKNTSSTSTSTPSPHQEHQHQRVRSACLPMTASSSSTNQMHLHRNYPQVHIGHPPDPVSNSSNSAFRHGQLLNSADLPSARLTSIPISTVHSSNETPVALRRQNRLHFDETKMVHEQMDRVEAEKCLESLRIGDYLLRRRADGNLAVSLRATDTVMHIKLERRDRSLWVLGEGPAFKSIGSVLRFYSKTELPIRGAEHVLLLEPVLVNHFA